MHAIQNKKLQTRTAKPASKQSYNSTYDQAPEMLWIKVVKINLVQQMNKSV